MPTAANGSPRVGIPCITENGQGRTIGKLDNIPQIPQISDFVIVPMERMYRQR